MLTMEKEMNEVKVVISCPYCEREWETKDIYKYRDGDRCPYCGMGHIEITKQS